MCSVAQDSSWDGTFPLDDVLFATWEKVAVTPERISNALQQVKCEAPLKHPVASLCPLQCCCGAAVASRALAG